MQIDELREYCLSKAAVTEDFPFGESTLVFRVMGKIFLLTGINDYPLTANMKCEPSKAIELREMYPEVQPGYHMNKKHWNTVEVEELDTMLVRSFIDHSYEQVIKGLSKAEKEQLEKM